MVILHVCSQSPTFLLSAQSKQEFTVEGEWEGVGGGGHWHFILINRMSKWEKGEYNVASSITEYQFI